MSGDRAHPAEARLLTANGGQPLQARQGLYPGNLRRHAQRVNVGHLVQAEGLRLAFGQGHVLARLVMQRDEDGGREGHDPRSLHAISRGGAAEKHLDLRRLFAAGNIGLPEPEHEFEQNGGVRRRRLAGRGGWWGFSVHGRLLSRNNAIACPRNTR